MEPEWRGMFFIKTGGVFFKMGRGLGGILAGYLNYWRPNLPVSQLTENIRYQTHITHFSVVSIAEIQ